MREEQEAFDLHAADFDTVTLMVNVIMLTYMEWGDILSRF